MIYLFFLVMIAITLLIILFGVYLIKRTDEIEKNFTLKTKGKVIEIKKEQHEDFDEGKTYRYYLYFPVIEYEVDGMVLIKKIGYGTSNQEEFFVDQEIEIFINPNNKEEIYIEKQKKLKNIGKILIIIGIFAIFFQILLFLCFYYL